MANREKKVIDIIPPGGNVSESFMVAHLLKESGHRRFFLVPALIGIGFVIILSYFILLKATVEIWPRYEKAGGSEDVYFSADIKTPDNINRRLPVTVVEITQEYSGTFIPKETAVKEEKAAGTIRVYNSTASSQVLIKDTRFLSADEKLFRLASRITVPAAAIIGGKSTPGTIDGKVIAVEAGEDYNIEATTFSIPGFAGTAKYTSFYGKSFVKMAGGHKGKTGIIIAEDLESAKNATNSELIKKGSGAVNIKLEEGLTLISGSKTSEISAIAYSAKIGDFIDSFNASGKIKIRFVAFKNEDLSKLAEKMLIPDLGSGGGENALRGEKMIRQNSVKIELNPENPDYKQLKGVVHMTVSGEVYSGINGDAVKNAVKNKSIKEAKMYLESQDFIDIVKITTKPFFVGSIPADPSRIDVVTVKQ